MFKIIKILFAGMLLIGSVFAVFIATGSVPDTKAVTGSELPDSAQQKLVESGIVFENEVIEYYYSEGLTSFVDYGNLFTDTRVISYELDPDTNERNIYSATYGEISGITFDKSDSMLEDSVIEVYESGEYSFLLYVSSEDGRDVKFYQKLTEIWNATVESERLISASLQGG